MQRFHNILVGVDLAGADASELAPPSREALRRAVWLAGHTRGDLTIMATVDREPHPAFDLKQSQVDEFERRAIAILDRLVADAKKEEVSARHTLAFGIAWKEICRQVAAGGHDLVVVGTRDVESHTRILFGSTGSKLLRACPCPVWVTRPDPDWNDLNILVPHDFSDVSQDALRIAVNGGQLVDTRLHLLHALEDQMSAPAWFGTAQKKIVREYNAGQKAEAKQKLQELLAATDCRTLPRGAEVHVVDGPPDEAILKAIDDFKIDLVVMAITTRSGLAEMMIGNTAERLIAHMGCSVIAVKPADFHCPLKLET